MLHIDLQKGVVVVGEGDLAIRHGIGTPEAFALISEAWLRSGWDVKYVYSFTWLGRPIIQLPEDMIRLQEVIFELRPDVILETGVAHGGSLVYYATLCRAMGVGRVIGVDVQIRPQNRKAIEEHVLSPLITLVEGDSVAGETIDSVRSMISPSDTVLVLLDSCHTKAHVLAELEAYAPLVSPGSYVVAMDGIMGQLCGAPRSAPDWEWNNPKVAAAEFVERHPEFRLVEPPFRFNEGLVTKRVTYWPGAFVQRKKSRENPDKNRPD